MTRVEKVFEVKWQGFNLRRGAVLAVVLGLLLIVGVLPHDRRYFLSAIFGALFVALSDPGGEYGSAGAPDGRDGRGRCAADGAGVRHRRRSLGVRGVGCFRGDVASRAGGEIRVAPVRRGLSSQHLVHHRPRPADAHLLRPAGSLPLRPDPHRTVEAGAGVAHRIGTLGRLHLHHVAGARAGRSAPTCRRDPRGYLAEAADSAHHPFRGDPGRRGVDRHRDRLRAAAAQRLLDAVRRHHCDEARPPAIHLLCRTARGRHDIGRGGGCASSCWPSTTEPPSK